MAPYFAATERRPRASTLQLLSLDGPYSSSSRCLLRAVRLRYVA
jgi:hypothetical protein